ncbi:unnamed protein product [Lymnaea stagnalis]|uniref:Hexosyltransferase n=1 Tax=Lymnaea stagnalis TaxID=6523 RepID=A0AAV2HYI1_LYMST
MSSMRPFTPPTGNYNHTRRKPSSPMKSDCSRRQVLLLYPLLAILTVSLALNIKLMLSHSSETPAWTTTSHAARLGDKAIKAEMEKKEFELAQLRSTVFFLFKPVIQTLNATFLESSVSLNCFVKTPGPVIVVESMLGHGWLRNLIRERVQAKKTGGGTATKGNKKYRGSLRVVFFVGKTPKASIDFKEAIRRETSTYKDIVQGSYDDADTAMKTLSMLRWLRDYCWRYHFIIQLHEQAISPADKWTNDVFDMLKAMRLASEELDHFVMAGAKPQKPGSGTGTANKVLGYTRSTVPILLQAGIRLDETHGSSIRHVESYSSALNIPFLLDGSFKINRNGGGVRGFLFS